MIKWKYNDGGRSDAGFRGETGDCVARAITIATGKPYQYVYDELSHRAKVFHARGRKPRNRTSARNGVCKRVYGEMLAAWGWEWIACMGIGTGCTVHLRADELPPGPIIARLSKHLCAVVDGVIHDTHDCSRGGTRCVYGYYHHPEKRLPHDRWHHPGCRHARYPAQPPAIASKAAGF